MTKVWNERVKWRISTKWSGGGDVLEQSQLTTIHSLGSTTVPHEWLLPSTILLIEAINYVNKNTTALVKEL